MTISKDLFLATLSMDAYNRGYAEGVPGLGGVGTNLGDAQIIQQSDTRAGSPGVGAGNDTFGWSPANDNTLALCEWRAV